MLLLKSWYQRCAQKVKLTFAKCQMMFNKCQKTMMAKSEGKFQSSWTPPIQHNHTKQMPVESKKPQIQSKSKRSAAIFGALDHQRVIQLVKICSFAKTCFLLFGPVSRPTSLLQYYLCNSSNKWTNARNRQIQETNTETQEQTQCNLCKKCWSVVTSLFSWACVFVLSMFSWAWELVMSIFWVCGFVMSIFFFGACFFCLVNVFL